MNWKKFFFYFRYYFIVIVVLAAALAMMSSMKTKKEYVRTNQEYVTQERVFDYADVLDDDEEEKLRKLIARSESRTGCDIVLVTLDESLEEYAKSYEDRLGPLYTSEYVMVYADNFYDEHNFGFDRAHGDGVLLLDNWYREADGKIYSWLSTCGRAEARFSGEMIDSLLNDALENVDDDPYGAYRKYVEIFTREMTGRIYIPVWAVILTAGIITLIFVCLHLTSRFGKKTVNENTYLAPGKEIRLKKKEDIFIRKSITQHKRETNVQGGGRSGGGGGGGHHISSGGISHGGGGHSR